MIPMRWSIQGVQNHEQLWVPVVPDVELDPWNDCRNRNGQMVTLSLPTQSIIYALPLTGSGESITSENVASIAERLAMLSIAAEGELIDTMFPSGFERGKIYLSLEDARRHIGLRVEAASIPDFTTAVLSLLRERARMSFDAEPH